MNMKNAPASSQHSGKMCCLPAALPGILLHDSDSSKSGKTSMHEWDTWLRSGCPTESETEKEEVVWPSVLFSSKNSSYSSHEIDKIQCCPLSHLVGDWSIWPSWWLHLIPVWLMPQTCISACRLFALFSLHYMNCHTAATLPLCLFKTESQTHRIGRV